MENYPAKDELLEWPRLVCTSCFRSFDDLILEILIGTTQWRGREAAISQDEYSGPTAGSESVGGWRCFGWYAHNHECKFRCVAAESKMQVELLEI